MTGRASISIRCRSGAVKAVIGVGAVFVAMAGTPRVGRAATAPGLTAPEVKRIALRAALPYLDQASPAHGLPYGVVSVRFEPRGRTFVWVVRVRAHYFRFDCPPSVPEAMRPSCLSPPAEYAVVHVRDSTRQAYSVAPIPPPSS